MNKKINRIVLISFFIFSLSTIAKENVFNPGATTVVYTKTASGCSPATSQTDLDVNNVRTTIMNGGDMWWNLDDARYEIPKDGNRHSMFAGALWIGGVDAGGQLKVAAMTYRQGGNDFWPGPLNTATATTDENSCTAWDKHFKIDRSVVEQHISQFESDDTYRNDYLAYPEIIRNWPAHPSLVDGTVGGADYYLAPFYDKNGDGFYNPSDGDYPDYNITGTNDNARLYGDQTLFWIFNDKGNIHTETEAEPLGLEIHAQAFGFTADNEVNDMTFYNYKIINRSTLPLEDTYFGQWVDPDLGYYLDDYVGCDVSLGLGFCYNGDAEDEGGAGYGFNPPAIGVDFFQGPIADPNDGIDNDRDGTIDEPNEQIIMSKFVYYNNDFTVIGNPSTGTHFYNYLRGIWKDNVPMTWGGDGHGSGQGATTDLCNFMFPGVSDPDFPGQEWTEVTAGNAPADRRFVQSAGPFTLQPGAVNEITTGVIWARANTGGNTASVALVKIYDKEAQALFDNNFNILNGPDAPDMEIRELDQQLIFTLSNAPSSNNFNESYAERDPYIVKPQNLVDSGNYYKFQGYLVYQLKDETVTQTDLDNPDKARLIFRCDVNDTVSGIINQYLDPILGVYTPIEEVSSVLSQGVIGSVDEGTTYTFSITDDKFALGNTKLINHKTYYFMALSYGYNRAEENADPYNVNDPSYDGRNQPYIGSRKNIKTESAIPHFIEPQSNGTTLNSNYGDGVKITRLEGTGNGGVELDLTQETIDLIMNDTNTSFRAFTPEYKNGMGPVEIKVVDPVLVPKGKYVLILEEPEISSNIVDAYGKWKIIDDSDGSMIISSNKSISIGEEKYITELGLSIRIKQVQNPGEDPANNLQNGLISAKIEFEDPQDRWLSGVPDRDDENGFVWGLNWIRSGSYTNDNTDPLSDYNQTDDPAGVYENLVPQSITVFGGLEVTGGTWAPYRFTSYYNDGPGFNKTVTSSYVKMKDLHSVDVVFTSDKSKWSRSVVVEAQENPALAIGGQEKMGVRKSPSVDKEGNPYGSSDYNDPNVPAATGWSWFPGYAIDIETGERLNIIFSEDSWLTDENGADMVWNPTSNVITDEFPQYDPGADPGEEFSGGNYLLGGKHFIYIVRGESWVKGTEEYLNAEYVDVDDSPNYDECKWIYAQLQDGGLPGKFNAYANISWVNIPLLSMGANDFPWNEGKKNDATVKLRVTKPYKPYETVAPYKILTKDDQLDTGHVYVVAYQNDPQTWGGRTITHAGVTYNPGDKFLAKNTTFTGNSRARAIYCGYTLSTSLSDSAISQQIEELGSNSYNPMYSFTTEDIASSIQDLVTAKSAIDLINVVPNPYYGYSAYETNQLDNRVKITNLPQRATISIFTVSGTLIKKIKKDDNVSYVDWDLKNDYGIPIASGLYIIHIKATIDKGNGEYVQKEKVLKWFGALRPIDLDTF